MCAVRTPIPDAYGKILRFISLVSTGLCAPTSLSVSSECHISTVNWTHVEGAEMVVATATGSNGQTHTCQSNTSDSCNFTDLHCGETYSVAAVTVDRGCRSMSTSNVELSTGRRMSQADCDV